VISEVPRLAHAKYGMKRAFIGRGVQVEAHDRVGAASAAGDLLLRELTQNTVWCARDIPLEAKRDRKSLVNRLRRGIMGEPDVEGDLVQCRQKLAKDILFQSMAGKQLLDFLTDWIRSHPKQTHENLRKLLMLQTKLHHASAKAFTERLAIVRQWIMQTVAAQVQIKALEKLRQIEDEMKPKAVNT
jgi:hypothetical protein